MFLPNDNLSINRSVVFVAEGVLVVVSLFLATTGRFSFNLEQTLNYELLVPRILVVTAICQICLYYHDLYGDRFAQFRRERAIKILKALK